MIILAAYLLIGFGFGLALVTRFPPCDMHEGVVFTVVVTLLALSVIWPAIAYRQLTVKTCPDCGGTKSNEPTKEIGNA